MNGHNNNLFFISFVKFKFRFHLFVSLRIAAGYFKHYRDFWRISFKMESFNTRFAKPSDSNIVNELIYVTGPDLFLYMFGKRAKDVLSYLFEKEYNLFSYEHCRIVEINDEIAGMILGYGYEAIEKESRNTGRLIMRYYGPGFITRVINLIRMDRIISDLSKGDYYISNVAIFEKFRRYGIGKRLIANAIDGAKKLNKSHIALDVEGNNKNAIEFYYHLGFKNTERKTINFMFNRKVSLLRMIKDVV